MVALAEVPELEVEVEFPVFRLLEVAVLVLRVEGVNLGLESFPWNRSVAILSPGQCVFYESYRPLCPTRNIRFPILLMSKPLHGREQFPR